ncbi:MAG: 30S ribosomal protein S3 [bacterium]|nr:30S ribosomal protein S3 [bacterium]
MIEREFVSQKMKEYKIQEFISENLRNVGHSHTKLQRTPLGEKIIIHASRPGLVVGRKGENISKLTRTLKKRFELENPQIEISEVEDINLNAQIVAERIASSLERFGSKRFKGAMHKAMEDVMHAGALGVEILLSGKVPSSRARSWRVYSGYLKKCGDVSLGVHKAIVYAKLKSGVIGIKVSIMPPDIKLPDKMELLEEKVEVIEEIKEEPKKEAAKPKASAKTVDKKDGAKDKGN